MKGHGKSPQRVSADVLLVADASSEEIGVICAAERIVLHELVSEVLSLEEVFFKLTASTELGA